MNKKLLKFYLFSILAISLIVIAILPLEKYFDSILGNYYLSELLHLGILWIVLLSGFALQIAIMIDHNGRIMNSLSLIDLATILLLLFFLFISIGKILDFSFNVKFQSSIIEFDGDPIISLGKNKAYLNGIIGQKSFDMLTNINNIDTVKVLKLNSPGGLIGNALEIAEFVKSNGISIIVEDECSSACVLIAISSNKLYTSKYSKFGFHNAASITKPESEIGKYSSSKGSREMFSFLQKNGIPIDIINIAKNTDSSEIYYISGSEFINRALALELR